VALCCVLCGCRPFEHGDGKCRGRGGSCKCTTVSRIYFRPRKAKPQSKLREPADPHRAYRDDELEEEAA
jgi:hypothetical protein